LQGPNSPSAPFTFDIRGGGGFWGIEFDFDCPEGATLDFKGQQFAMLVQAQALTDGLIIMGMTGGANVQGTKGDVILLAPAYNVTAQEVEKIVEMFGASVDAMLEAYRV
jgi:adenosylmethionine-8-amino-7-oxononanoate aminotransferase